MVKLASALASEFWVFTSSAFASESDSESGSEFLSALGVFTYLASAFEFAFAFAFYVFT